ncbi:MAG: ADP-ribosylation factor-like protein, partial [Candidatus Helarchaeota archaeon]
MEQKKIVFLGLDNAGKTSFIRAFDENYNEIQNLTPTVRIERSNIEILDVSISRWDCGGQEKFRKEYLMEESQVLTEADYVLYFIDIMAEDRYDEALGYLKDIIEAYKLTGFIPPFMICLHKADPSYIDIATVKKKMLPRWEIKDRVNRLTERLSKLLTGVSNSINLTSIYDRNSILIAFSKVLKSFTPKSELIDLVNVILVEFVKKNDLLASSIIERKSLLYTEFSVDPKSKELFSALLMNGLIFYENIQVVKRIFKMTLLIENYRVMFTSYIKNNRRYFLTIMARLESDLTKIIDEFETKYFD